MATRRPICAHYAPTMCFNRSMGPPVGPLCAHHALTMCPLCVSTAAGFNRSAYGGATMRPLCAHDVPIMCLNLWGFNRWSRSATTMRPRCAHYVHPLLANRFGVQSMRPPWGNHAPVRRSPCADYVLKVSLGSIDGPTMRSLCAPSVFQSS